jgi:oligosaccharide repeat unit polymerase
MNFDSPVGSGTRLMIGTMALITVILWLCAMGVSQNYFYAAAGMSIFTLSLMPILALKRYDWFCPWSSVLLAELYGCTLPSICMTFGLPNQHIIDSQILLNQDPWYFVVPSMIVLLSVGCVALGYFITPQRDNPTTLFRAVDPSRLIMVGAACFFISALAFAAYFMFNGGIAEGISSKRGTINTLEVGSDENFSQYGYLRQAAKLATIAMLMLTVFWTKFRHPDGKFGVIRGLIIFAFFAVSVAFPFYSSSRAGIVWVIASLVGALYYFGQKLFTKESMLMFGLVFSLVVVTTLLRNENAHDASVEERIGRLMLNRHGPDIATSSHVINSIPEKLDYQYGATIAVWAIAPIPRELMPSKPLMHCGPIIGQAIYKTQVSGVPPGMPAELYWNFHVFGVIVGSYFIGVILKLIYNFFRNVDVDPVLLVPVYCYAVFPIGFKLMTHSVGMAFVMSAVELVIVAGVAWFVSRPMSRVYAQAMVERAASQPQTGELVGASASSATRLK